MSDSNQTHHYTPTPAVRQAVQDAQRMLTYAVQSRLSLDHETVKTLTRAKNVLRQNAWTPGEEIEFWKAFTKLNAQVKPVTIRSLKSVFPAPDSHSWLRFMTRARFFLLFYWFLTAVALLVFISLQVYWVIGADLVREIDTLIEKKQEMLRLESATHEKTENPENIAQGTVKEGKPVEAEKKLLDEQIRANYLGLLKWSSYWQKALFVVEGKFEGKNVLLDEKLNREKISRLHRKIETDKRLLTNIEEAQRAATEKRIEANQREQVRLQRELDEEKMQYKSIIIKLPSEFTLEVLQSYIIPMLCGFLGAAIYVLRSLTDEIENVTYTIGTDIKYELRLALGALGGLGIGWFLVPEKISGLQAVTPLALAFLVGYNIELLFSIMDGFIESVSKKNPTPSEGS
jgi:hypothetical protein